MRTLLLITLAFSATGCSWLRCRLPFGGRRQNLNVTSCERKGNELHVTVQQPCGPQPCGPQAACLPGNPCGNIIPGTTSRVLSGPSCRALTMDWAHIPIPIVKVQRLPVCQQVMVPGCAQQVQVLPGYAPVIQQKSPEQPVPAPVSNGNTDTARAAEMENRARQLEDQVNQLRDVLNRQQTGASYRGTPSPGEVPILPPPQRWGPEDGVPTFTQSPIEQLSGSSKPRSAGIEQWPYSPQNPHRRAIR